MARRSRITQLPRDLQDRVHALIRQGRTIEEITAHLAALDADVSRSAVGRYVKSAREQMERYQAAQQIAGQWVAALGEQPEGDVGALLAEMLKTLAFQTMSQMGDEKKPPEPGDLMLLGRAVKDVLMASRHNLELQLKREKAALERAAKAAETTAREEGLSDEQWAAIRAKFLGVKVAA